MLELNSTSDLAIPSSNCHWVEKWKNLTKSIFLIVLSPIAPVANTHILVNIQSISMNFSHQNGLGKRRRWLNHVLKVIAAEMKEKKIYAAMVYIWLTTTCPTNCHQKKKAKKKDLENFGFSLIMVELNGTRNWVKPSSNQKKAKKKNF